MKFPKKVNNSYDLPGATAIEEPPLSMISAFQLNLLFSLQRDLPRSPQLQVTERLSLQDTTGAAEGYGRHHTPFQMNTVHNSR